MPVTVHSLHRIAASLLVGSTLIPLPASAAQAPYFRFNSGVDGLPNTGEQIKVDLDPVSQVPGSGGTGNTGGGGTGTPGAETNDPVSGPSTSAPVFAGSNVTLRATRPTSFSMGTPSGGVAPYRWNIASGPIPAGLSLSPDGIISGIPVAPGIWPNVQLGISDGGGLTGRTSPFSIRVLGLPTLAYQSQALPRGQELLLKPSAGNLMGAARYALAGDAIPAWIRFDAATGTLSGTPDGTGKSAPMTVRLVDVDGAAVTSAPFTVEVTAVFASLDVPPSSAARTGVEYSLTIGRTGISDPVSYEVDAASGPLPPGIALDGPNNRLHGFATAPATYDGIIIKGKGANDVTAWTKPFSVTVRTASVGNPGTLVANLNKAFTTKLTGNALEAGASFVSTGSPLPPGLNLAADGTIAGVPTKIGKYPGINVSASDTGGSFPSGTFAIDVVAETLQVSVPKMSLRQSAPVDLAPTVLPATQGLAWTYSGTLPAGLSVQPGTGHLTGAAATPGKTAGLILTATSPSGLTGSTVPFDVDVYGPLTARGDAFGAMVGQDTDLALSASNVITGASWTMQSGTLPEGLSLTSAGHIVGTPAAEGTAAQLVAKVTDFYDGSVAYTAPFTVTVAASNRMLVTGVSGLYATRVGRVLTLPKPTVLNAQGTPTFEVNGSLPGGLAITGNGIVTGTASSAGNGEPLKIVVRDQRPSTASSPAFAVRLAGPLSIAKPQSLTAQVGGDLASTVSASNVMGTPTWSLLPGPDGAALPVGTRFVAQTGRILGRPLATATLRGLTLRLSDSSDGEVATSAPFDLTVTPGLLIEGPYALNARVGQDFDSGTSFKVTGAAADAVWKVSTGTLPPGLRIDVATGRITGKPTQEVTATELRLRVDQADGLYGESQPFSIAVVGGMKVAVGANQMTRVNTPFTVTPAALNNLGDVTWSLAQGAPPTGMSFDRASGRLYGTPTVPGTYGGIRFQARDGIGQVAVSDPVSIQVGDLLRIAGTSPLNPYQTRMGTPIVPFKAFTVSGAIGDYKVEWTDNQPLIKVAPDGTVSGTWHNWTGYWFGTAKVTDSTGATAYRDVNAYMVLDRVWISGKGWPWSHQRSSSAVGYVGKPFSFYDNRASAGIEGLLNGDLRRIEYVDPSKVPAWARLDTWGGDITGTPDQAGTFSFDVRVIDGVDGMSDVHTYVIEVKPPIPPSTAQTRHIKNRQGVGFGPSQVVDLTGATFAQAEPSYRAAGWCNHNMGSMEANGSGLWVDGACQVRSWPWDSNNVNVWSGLWVEITDDTGAKFRTDFDYQIAPQLTIQGSPAACTRTGGEPLSRSPGAVSGLMGTATYKLIRPYHGWADNQVPDGMSYDPATATVSGMPANVQRFGDMAFVVTDSWDGATAQGGGFALERREPFAADLGLDGQVITVDAGDWFNRTLRPSGHVWYAPFHKWTVLSGTVPGEVRTGWDQFGFNIYVDEKATEPGTYPLRLRYETDCPAGTAGEATVTLSIRPYVQPKAPQTVYMREGIASATNPAPTLRDALLPVKWYVPCCNALPAGIDVDAGSGQLVGTPGPGTAGKYTLGLLVYDQRGGRHTSPFDLIVLPGPGVAYDSKLGARVGLALAANPMLSNIEGGPSFTWASAPPPPDLGLTLDPSTGVIGGQPAYVAKVENLQVSVRDSNNLSTKSNVFALDVSTGPTASIASAFPAKMGDALSAKPVSAGTIGAVTWKLAGGTLPLGLSVDAATGEIKGTPILKGDATGLTLSVRDSTGAVATTNAFAINVANGPLPTATLTLGCNYANRGSPPAYGGPSGSGGSMAGPAGSGSSATPDPNAIPDCLVNLWTEDWHGTYQDFLGAAWIVDTAKGAAIDNLTVKLVDMTDGTVRTAYRYSGTSLELNMGWVMTSIARGPGSYSRKFYAVAEVPGTGVVRNSGPFTLSGVYGQAPAVETWRGPEAGAVWTWDKQVCITTCNEYGACDGRQTQVCNGGGCPYPMRSCYQVAARGSATSQPIGSPAIQTCYDELHDLSMYFCN